MSGTLNSNPGWNTGVIPAASTWDSLWGGKVDGVGGTMASGSAPGTNVSSSLVTTTPPGSGSVARTPAARWGEKLRLKDFGPCGYGVADSSPAINAATAYIRANQNTSGANTFALDIPNDIYTCLSPLNFTGIKTIALAVEGNGATLVGAFGGGIVFDFFNSRFFRVSNLNIGTDGVHVPQLGIAGGNTGNGVADCHSFHNVWSSGDFSLGGAYFTSTETSTMSACHFWNTNASSSSYGLVVDGQNHFGVSSTFAPQTLPADTAQSFNEMVFISPDIRHSGGGSACWIGCNSRHSYIGGYAAVSAAVPAVVLWLSANSGGGGGVFDLFFDVHQETTSCTDVFLLTGPQAVPALYGMTYRDPGPQASNSIFKLSGSVTGVYSIGCVVEIIGAYQNGCKLFDAPSAWTYYGNIKIPDSATMSNLVPNRYQGVMELDGVTTLAGTVLTVGPIPASAPTITAGGGAPSGSNVQPNGSLYINSSGGTGTRLYVSAGSGTWAAVSGV